MYVRSTIDRSNSRSAEPSCVDMPLADLPPAAVSGWVHNRREDHQHVFLSTSELPATQLTHCARQSYQSIILGVSYDELYCANNEIACLL
jgi:hypothetical protein